MPFSVRVDNPRMTALTGAFSAALRRSQDFSIGDQKHQHADRSAPEAPGFCASSNQSCFVRGEKKKTLFSTLLLHLLYSPQKICNEDFSKFNNFSWWKRVIY